MHIPKIIARLLFYYGVGGTGGTGSGEGGSCPPFTVTELLSICIPAILEALNVVFKLLYCWPAWFVALWALVETFPVTFTEPGNMLVIVMFWLLETRAAKNWA